MKATLQKSKDFTEEYCCSVVKVGELTPVENSDRLMQTRINGESIVVNKQDVKEGDVMLKVRAIAQQPFTDLLNDQKPRVERSGVVTAAYVAKKDGTVTNTGEGTGGNGGGSEQGDDDLEG